MLLKNAKTLHEKADTHTVIEHGAGWTVISGLTGNQYPVTSFAGTFSCGCDWGKYNSESACSHVQAVVEYLERGICRRTAAWANMDDAERQHRPVVLSSNGITVTSRRLEPVAVTGGTREERQAARIKMLGF